MFPLVASQLPIHAHAAHMDLRDCVCFPATRSAIGEDGRIVSIQHAVEQRLRSGFVYVAL
jgi:hypothetical protein